MSNWKTWTTILGMGMIAGMRSIAAPAFLSQYLSENRSARKKGQALKFLGSDMVSKTLKAMAAGELVVDKMPNMPDRIEPPILGGRVASGAMVGALLGKAHEVNPVASGLVGGAAAVAAAYAGWYLRTKASDRFAVPQQILGAVEDAIMLGSGAGLLKLEEEAKKRKLLPL